MGYFPKVSLSNCAPDMFSTADKRREKQVWDVTRAKKTKMRVSEEIETNKELGA